jgi:hypothetical protein
LPTALVEPAVAAQHLLGELLVIVEGAPTFPARLPAEGVVAVGVHDRPGRVGEGVTEFCPSWT